MNSPNHPGPHDDLGKLLELARQAPTEPAPAIRPGFAPRVVRVVRGALAADGPVRGLDRLAVATSPSLPATAPIRWAVLACLVVTVAIALLSTPPRSGGSWMTSGAGSGFESHLSNLVRFPGR